VKQIDLDGVKIDNKATVSYTYAGQSVQAEDTVTVTPEKNPGITILKESTDTGFNAVGDVLTYTLSVINSGNIGLSNVVVTDPLTGFTETILTLPAGSTQQFTTTYTIKLSDVTAKKVSNTAIAEFSDGGITYSSSASKVLDYTGVVNVILANLDNLQDTPLNILETRIAGNVLSNDLMNGMPIIPSNVSISIVNNAGLTGLSIDSSGNVIVPDGTAVGTYTIMYKICDVNNLSNCSEAMVIIEVMNGVNLKITKEAQASNWFEGDEFYYLLKVENNGVSNATDVVVTDILPEGIRYKSSEITGGTAETLINGQDISWKIASLASGSFVEIKLFVKATAILDDREKTIVNVASVKSSETDMSPEDNISSAVIQVKPFFIPNVITPNGDGSNDSFEIQGLGRFVSNEIVIMNRWGDHVFQRVNYENDWSANGLTNGTYFYVLIAIDEFGKRYEFKGWVQVITE
jgi:gliding motility-associated-like protein/uncharacterized repeat protein (TIGR01451 family)